LGGEHPCCPISPGASLDKPIGLRKTAVRARLSYFDVGKNKIGTFTGLETGYKVDDYSLIVNFYCAGASKGSSIGRKQGPDICCEYQGIPW
jgi:hypothetical protein